MEPTLSDWRSLPTALLRQGAVEESDWMHKSQEGQAFHYHALECWKCHEQEDWTGEHPTGGKHQHLLHPGDASSVQQILQGEGLLVLQVRQNRLKQRRSIDSCQKQHQCLSDRHSHGRLSIRWLRSKQMLWTFSWWTSTAPTTNPCLDTISTEVSNFIIVGDFNSHSQSWRYQHTDRRGEEVENWQDENCLLFINSPSDQPVTARVWCSGGIDRKKNSTINLTTAYGVCFYCLHINLSSHTGRHNKQIFLQCSGERQNIFEKLQQLYHYAPHTPNRNIHSNV